jgi:hypothetical protein
MLEAVWKEEKADERTRFLNTFEFGLSMDDEPFLDAALDDRAQDVRQAAIELLGMLPESRYVQRRIARGLPLVELDTSKDGETIFSVHVISKDDDQLRRDGIDLTESKRRTNVKRELTQFVLAHVPPERWCEAFHITKEDLLKIALYTESDEHTLMINALAWGAYRAHDIEFATMLITTSPARLEGNIGGQLLHMLPDPGAVLVTLLKNRQAMSVAEIPLLRTYQQPWSVELTLAMAAIVVSAVEHWQSFAALRTSLHGFAVYFPINVADNLFRHLNAPDKIDGSYGKSWKSVVDEVRTLLDFRREMLAALHS